MLKLNDDFSNLKLGGFGFQGDPLSPKGENKFSKFFVSPEKEDSAKKDIWSVGMLTYLLLCGSVEDFSSGVINFDGECWDNVSRMAKNFIRSLLNPKAEKRPTAHAALEAKWLSTGLKS